MPYPIVNRVRKRFQKIGNDFPEIRVVEPRSFDDLQSFLSSILQGKTLIVNLGMMPHDESQRAVDFLSGASFSKHGSQSQITNKIFLFTNSSISINKIYGGCPKPSWTAEATKTPS